MAAPDDERLATLEREMAALRQDLRRFRRYLRRAVERGDEREKRIRALEDWRIYWKPGLALLQAVAAAVILYVVSQVLTLATGANARPITMPPLKPPYNTYQQETFR